ncbi:MAG: aminotransferase class I/II-fold pyridoxal phosphate-dependent enzyme [Spirochaetes bacterium]|nr:aminotransferase class I/II-fold pyridoxal phosphate-dependent enzyme [Spirochaetota bacterium]
MDSKLQFARTKNPQLLISEAVKAIPPSGIREFFDIVYSMPDCISLGVGEPDFITPWRIAEMGMYAIKDGYTHYTPNRGLPELCDLISTELEKTTGTRYSPSEEIIVTMGVSQGLDIALRSIVNPGDEVIIPQPCYVSYGANVTLLGGKPIYIPTTAGEEFKLNIDRLRAAITRRTKAILLNYPSNPTGTTLPKSLLEDIATLAEKYNFIIISDEIYSSLCYDAKHWSIISIPAIKDRVIYLNGFSKSHAMTGWRLGYVAAPKYLIDMMLKIHQYTALCASSIAQYAALEALKNSHKDVEKMVNEYRKRRNYIVNRFRSIGLPCLMPEGAFYVFPDVSPTGLDGRKFALELLRTQKVAVVPGDVFGECGKNHIRCSYATSMENINEAMKRIEIFCSERIK